MLSRWNVVCCGEMLRTTVGLAAALVVCALSGDSYAQKLAVPVPLSPRDGSSPFPVYSWKPVKGAEGYRLVLTTGPEYHCGSKGFLMTILGGESGFVFLDNTVCNDKECSVSLSQMNGPAFSPTTGHIFSFRAFRPLPAFHDCRTGALTTRHWQVQALKGKPPRWNDFPTSQWKEEAAKWKEEGERSPQLTFWLDEQRSPPPPPPPQHSAPPPKPYFVNRRYSCRSVSEGKTVGSCDMRYWSAKSCEDAVAQLNLEVAERGDVCRHCSTEIFPDRVMTGESEWVQGGTCQCNHDAFNPKVCAP